MHNALHTELACHVMHTQSSKMAADEDPDTINVKDHFGERDEIVSLIAALPTIFHDFRLVEAGFGACVHCYISLAMHACTAHR